MIVTVTPNPALDITYAVPSLTPGSSHRVEHVLERAGGKGINAAGVLTAMAVPCVAVAPVGSVGRATFAADLESRGIAARLVESPRPTRRSVAVTERDGRATLFNEAGPAHPQAVWAEVARVVTATLEAADSSSVLAVCGSLPPGTDPDVVARLAAQASRSGTHVVLDVSGEALRRALAAGPSIVKPNRAEAAATVGGGAAGIPNAATLPDVRRLGSALVEGGAQAAVISDGAAGLTLVAHTAQLRARLRAPLLGNPTGAGDALTAALAASLAGGGGLPGDRDAWAQVLRRAVAWSASAVLQPVAGTIEPAHAQRLAGSVEVEEIGA